VLGSVRGALPMTKLAGLRNASVLNQRFGLRSLGRQRRVGHQVGVVDAGEVVASAHQQRQPVCSVVMPFNCQPPRIPFSTLGMLRRTCGRGRTAVPHAAGDQALGDVVLIDGLSSRRL
jgi:hypothetical protein